MVCVHIHADMADKQYDFSTLTPIHDATLRADEAAVIRLIADNPRHAESAVGYERFDSRVPGSDPPHR